MATSTEATPQIPATHPVAAIRDASARQPLQPPPAYYYEPQTRDFSTATHGNGAAQGRLEAARARRDPDSDSLASSVLPSYATASQRSHQVGYRSEKEYLEALREFVEEKSYSVPVDRHGVPTTLTGFYGKKTTEEYATAARVEKERRREMKQIQKERQWELRQSSSSAVRNVGDGNGDDEGQQDATLPQRRRRSLREWMSSRRD